MIVHEIKHPTESLGKILDFLQNLLQSDELEEVIQMLDDLAAFEIK